MDTQTQALLDAVLALPETERVLFAQRLLETLPIDVADVSDEEWAAELERRRQEVLAGEGGTVPWSELKQQT